MSHMETMDVAKDKATIQMANAANNLDVARYSGAAKVLRALGNCIIYGRQTYGPQLTGAVEDFLK